MLTRAEWVEIIGLVTNLQEGRFKLTRGGEVWEMTANEQEAVAKLRKAWQSGQIEYTNDR